MSGELEQNRLKQFLAKMDEKKNREKAEENIQQIQQRKQEATTIHLETTQQTTMNIKKNEKDDKQTTQEAGMKIKSEEQQQENETTKPKTKNTNNKNKNEGESKQHKQQQTLEN